MGSWTIWGSLPGTGSTSTVYAMLLTLRSTLVIVPFFQIALAGVVASMMSTATRSPSLYFGFWAWTLSAVIQTVAVQTITKIIVRTFLNFIVPSGIVPPVSYDPLT